MDDNPKNRLNGILCGLASSLIWGAFPVMTRFGVSQTSLDASDITFIRYSVSGAILLPFLLRSGLRGLGWKEIALMVLGIGSPYMLVVSQGLTSAPVEHFAVITPGSMIMFSILISVFFLGARLSLKELSGIGLIMAGVGLVGYQNLQGATSGQYHTYFIFLLGGLLWSIYTVSTKQFSVTAFHATAVVSVFSMIIYLPIYLYFDCCNVFHAPLEDVMVQVVYQGILVSMIALFFYSKAVQLLGASIGATFAALVPGAAIVLATLVLGEPPSTISLLGLCVVTCGMIMTLFGRPARPQNG